MAHQQSLDVRLAKTARRRDIAFRAALDTWARQRPSIAPVRSWAPLWRRVAAGAATLLVIGGLAGYAGLFHSASASAAILQRATRALQQVAPGDAVHARYAITMGNGAAPSVLEEWVQPASDGTIARAMLATQDATGQLQSRTLQTGEQTTTYNAGTNTLVQAAVDPSALPNPLDATALARDLQAAQSGGEQDVRSLGQSSLDGHAVDVVAVQRPTGTATLYIDARTAIIRQLDLSQADASGTMHTTWSLRLTSYEEIPATAIPAGTFALNAPSTARPVTAADGSAQLGTQHISVAQAAALPNRPAPLLPGPVDGLQLTDVRYIGTPTAMIVNYIYTDAQDQKVLGINVITWPTGILDPTDRRYSFGLPRTTTQHLSLTIAGQPVQALYDDATAPLLIYSQGGAGVRIGSIGLGKQEFFRAVNALVDGHATPAAVAQAQREWARRASLHAQLTPPTTHGQ